MLMTACFSSLLQAAMAAAAALLPFPTTLSSAKWQPSMLSKDQCITFLSSCALRRTSFLPKDSLLLLRCRAPCFMSVDVDSEPVEVDTQPADVPLETRREERFAVLNTGKWECRSCGYIYDQFVGDSSYPIAAGIEFGKLPEDWRCPTCGAARSYFNSKSVEIAGFAENQSYGFGTNSLTAGQKSILIYGSLLLAFLLFLSGYFLQ